MPAKKPMSEWKHGTHGTYVNGCRCDLCRAASTAYKRARARLRYHANLAESRRKGREKERARYYRTRSVAVESFDRTLIARDAEYRAAASNATGELRALIEAQCADDVRWIRPERHAVPLAEERWKGWGIRGRTLGEWL